MGFLIFLLILAAIIWMIAKITRGGREDLDHAYRMYGGYKGYKDYLIASRNLRAKLYDHSSAISNKSFSQPQDLGSSCLFKPIGEWRRHSNGLSDDGLFNNNIDLFSDEGNSSINPASGLPMIGGVDIEGNPYGTSSSDWGSGWGGHNSWDDF